MRLVPLLLTSTLSGCSGLRPVGDTKITLDDSGSSGVSFGSLYVSPGALEFGEVALDDQVALDVVLTNTGQATLTITDTLVTGDSNFSLESVVSLPAELTAGADTVITVGFSPAAEVDYTGTLRLEVDGVDEQATVTLTGTGSSAVGEEGGGEEGGGEEGGGEGGGDGGLELSVTSIDFGVVDVMDGASELVTITNSAEDDILVTDFVSTSSVFSVSADWSTPAVISPGLSRTISVDFWPTDEVTSSGTIVMETNPSTYSQSIEVSGVGEITCTICAPIISVDTGGSDAYSMLFSFNTATGGYSLTQPVVIENLGDLTLDITDATLSNDALSACGTFEVDWDGTTISLEQWETASIDVTYTITTAPCIEGPGLFDDSNNLHIVNSDTTQPDYKIGLSGFVLF